jgi:hypothetical protein
MEKNFVSYAIAKKLKELGFSEFSFAEWVRKDGGEPELILSDSELFPMGYTELETIPAPLYDQVIDWLIEKHELFVSICFNNEMSHEVAWKWNVHDIPIHKINKQSTNGYSKREALDRGILKAIELLKD